VNTDLIISEKKGPCWPTVHRGAGQPWQQDISPILMSHDVGPMDGGGTYETTSAKPVSSQTGCWREASPAGRRVTTTFDNGRTHVVTVSLWAVPR
jgi:hypothetical protein